MKSVFIVQDDREESRFLPFVERMWVFESVESAQKKMYELGFGQGFLSLSLNPEIGVMNIEQTGKDKISSLRLEVNP